MAWIFEIMITIITTHSFDNLKGEMKAHGKTIAGEIAKYESCT